MSTILTARNLRRSFGGVAALDNLTFEIQRGEILGVIGPNGAGKSTLIDVLTGRLRASGEIILDGQPITGLKPERICRRGLARTFQEPLVFPHLSVQETVRLAAQFGSAGEASTRRISEALDFVGLSTEQAHDLMRDLDLFRVRLVTMAAMLVTDPILLLLDEPLGGLSASEVRRLGACVRDANTELGVTVCLVEHLVREIAPLCDRFMVLYNGKRLSLDTPTRVMKDPEVIDVYLGGSI